jgi:hypothetical protein
MISGLRGWVSITVPLAVKVSDGFLWFWIGTHAEYDEIVE